MQNTWQLALVLVPVYFINTRLMLQCISTSHVLHIYCIARNFRCFRELAINPLRKSSMNIANSGHNVHCNLFNEMSLEAVPRKLSASKIAFFGEYIVNQLAIPCSVDHMDEHLLCQITVSISLETFICYFI